MSHTTSSDEILEQVQEVRIKKDRGSFTLLYHIYSSSAWSRLIKLDIFKSQSFFLSFCMVPIPGGWLVTKDIKREPQVCFHRWLDEESNGRLGSSGRPLALNDTIESLYHTKQDERTTKRSIQGRYV